MTEAPEQKQRIEKAVAAALAELSRQKWGSDGNLTIPMLMKHELSGHVELAIAGQLDLTQLVTAILAADKSAGTLEAMEECVRVAENYHLALEGGGGPWDDGCISTRDGIVEALRAKIGAAAASPRA